MRISPQVLFSFNKFTRNYSTLMPAHTLLKRGVNELPRRQPTMENRLRTEGNSLESERPELIIFDKDGTLICFHSIWIPWAIDTAKRLEQSTGIQLSREVYQLLGLCPIQGKVHPGLLAEGTMGQIKHEIEKLLVTNGLDDIHELDVVDKCIQDSQTRCPSTLKAIHDMRLLFSTLRNNNVKVAICTADNRCNTISMLRWFNVEDRVDFVVCGDDPGSKPKPHPRNAIFICRTLGVAPENTVMVGDTVADLGMARAAGLRAAVGVLSGVGGPHHLESHADILVPHVGTLIGIFDDLPEKTYEYM